VCGIGGSPIWRTKMGPKSLRMGLLLQPRSGAGHDANFMSGGPADNDPLSRWLTTEGVSTLDAITGGALDIVGVMDRDLTVRYLNWTTAGLERKAVIGSSVLDLVPPAYRDTARETYLNVLRTGNGARFETMYKDGADLLVFDVRVGPIRFEGEVIGLIAMTDNVTELRRARADRDRFFSLSLDMLIVVSPDGLFKRVNPAFAKALGYGETELIGTPFIELVHPEDRARTLEVAGTDISGAQVVDFENRYRRKDGTYRVLAWRGNSDPVTGDMYGVARDITHPRATEAQLRQAQKMEAVGQLAGGVAHDFNNLLLAILANAQLGSHRVPLSPEVADHFAEIEGAAQRAADLTKQLLAFSRRQPIHPVSVDLNALTGGLMKMLRRLLPENITIGLVPGERLATIRADPSQLEQVILNLCVNARDAMDRGGRLEIRTENLLIDRDAETHLAAKPGHYVLLSVSDTGTGMTAEVRERAFEPFFTTKDRHRGTGLGLSTVYGIVQQHDGMVHVDTELGAGSVFKVYLPSERPVGVAARSSGEVAATPLRGRETILVVEDEERVRRAVIHILERAGHRTIAAANGLEAIRLVQEGTERIHLVLLDVVMPELGGPETWSRLRGVRDGMRVLFTTGYASEQYREHLPPDAEVLEKPYRAEELLNRVRKALDG
jgi:two-component system cell cycle sensor histidine kinase/response regulator CckA